MKQRKEIAKFFAGVAANQVLIHAALAISGIQFTLAGIAYTRGLHVMAVVVWAILLVLLVYYAWMKK